MIFGVLHQKRLESVTIEDLNWSIYMETKKEFFIWCIVTYIQALTRVVVLSPVCEKRTITVQQKGEYHQQIPLFLTMSHLSLNQILCQGFWRHTDKSQLSAPHERLILLRQESASMTISVCSTGSFLEYARFKLWRAIHQNADYTS